MRRLEAEDYVDAKLANFEVVLAKTMRSDERGRGQRRGRCAGDGLAGAAAPSAPVQPAPGGQLYDYESS